MKNANQREIEDILDSDVGSQSPEKLGENTVKLMFLNLKEMYREGLELDFIRDTEMWCYAYKKHGDGSWSKERLEFIRLAHKKGVEVFNNWLEAD